MPIYEDRYCKAHGITKQRLVNYKTGPRFRCQKCDNDNQNRYAKKLKQKSVDYKGGCCQRCGYDKYFGALEFHHLDPSQKDFGITHKNVKWETIQSELDKCILLCSNCHKEVHAGL